MTTLFLSIYQPKILLSGTVTSSSEENTVLNYSQDFGDWNDVRVGMVFRCDGKRVRIKSISSSTITLAENSWDFSSKQFDVLAELDVEAIFPKMEIDKNNDENVIFYKDGDIQFSGQTRRENYEPIVNIGNHRAAFLRGGSWTENFTADAYTLNGASITSYLWECVGATVVSPTSQSTDIVFSSSGHYVVSCKVTDSNGKSFTGYRYVSIYDDTNKPHDCTLEKITGSMEGGYTADVSVYEPVEDGVAVLFSENNETIFVGYNLSTSTQRDVLSEDKTYKLKLVSLDNLLKKLSGFSFALNSTLSPSVWWEAEELDVYGFVYLFLRWHTTVLNVCDVVLSCNNPKIQYGDTSNTNIFDALSNFVEKTVFGTVFSDLKGTLYISKSPESVFDYQAEFPSPQTFTKEDYLSMLVIGEKDVGEVSYVETNGIYYEGDVSGIFTPVLAASPSKSPEYEGAPQTYIGLAGSQDDLNKYAGLKYAYANQAKEYIVKFVGIVDFAPLRRVIVEDAVDGFLVSSEIEYRDFSFVTSCQLVSALYPEKAEALPVPEPPTVDAISPPDFPNIPPIVFPQIASGGGVIKEEPEEEPKNVELDWLNPNINLNGGVLYSTMPNKVITARKYFNGVFVPDETSTWRLVGQFLYLDGAFTGTAPSGRIFNFGNEFAGSVSYSNYLDTDLLVVKAIDINGKIVGTCLNTSISLSDFTGVFPPESYGKGLIGLVISLNPTMYEYVLSNFEAKIVDNYYSGYNLRNSGDEAFGTRLDEISSSIITSVNSAYFSGKYVATKTTSTGAMAIDPHLIINLQGVAGTWFEVSEYYCSSYNYGTTNYGFPWRCGSLEYYARPLFDGNVTLGLGIGDGLLNIDKDTEIEQTLSASIVPLASKKVIIDRVFLDSVELKGVWYD